MTPKHIRQAAALSDGRQRCEGSCKFFPCNARMLEVCSAAFRRGFAKGAAYEHKRNKEK